MRYDKEDIDTALDVLRRGGIILYPTDTVWGIGCDATNEEAVSKIYALKQREDSKSMLILLDALGKLQAYIEEVPNIAWDLQEVSKGQRPITLIYPGAKNLARNLIADDGSIGIRITNEAFSHALCERLKHPIVSTSANISGQPTAKNYSQIAEAIKEGVDYICRFRREDEEEKQPSSIIKIGLHSEIQIIRP